MESYNARSHFALPTTGHRHWKFRTVKVGANDALAIEAALNKFGGFGYDLKGSHVVVEKTEGVTTKSMVLIFKRRCRKPSQS